jgi:hypothetical protein
VVVLMEEVDVPDDGGTVLFEQQLDLLLRGTFLLRKRLQKKPLQVFMEKGMSTMGKNSTWSSKDGKKKTNYFACSQTKECCFRLCLRLKEGVWSFSVGEKGVMAHSDHDLVKPKRSSAFIVELLKTEVQKMQSNGVSGLDLVSQVAKKGHDAGVDVLSASINRARRDLEKKHEPSQMYRWSISSIWAVDWYLWMIQRSIPMLLHFLE